jgi:hypothetical protein
MARFPPSHDTSEISEINDSFVKNSAEWIGVDRGALWFTIFAFFPSRLALAV